MRSYTENNKHKFNWLKVIHADDFSQGDVLSSKSKAISEIQVSIVNI